MNFDDTIMKDYQFDVAMLDRTTVDTSYGGVDTVWKRGASFIAAMIQPQTGTSEIANAITQTLQYKVVTGTDVTLRKDDYFRRLKDGKDFVVLNDNFDPLAPESSTLQIRCTTAKEVTLPADKVVWTDDKTSSD